MRSRTLSTVGDRGGASREEEEDEEPSRHAKKARFLALAREGETGWSVCLQAWLPWGRRRSVRHLLALRQCTVSLSSRQGDAGVGSLRSTSNERHRERSAGKQEAFTPLPQDASKVTVGLPNPALSPAQVGRLFCFGHGKHTNKCLLGSARYFSRH